METSKATKLFVKRMLKMACNALCYHILISCVSSHAFDCLLASAVQPQRCSNLWKKEKKNIMNYDVIMVVFMKRRKEKR